MSLAFELKNCLVVVELCQLRLQKDVCDLSLVSQCGEDHVSRSCRIQQLLYSVTDETSLVVEVLVEYTVGRCSKIWCHG